MKKRFLIANWKMNKCYGDSLSYTENLEQHYKDDLIWANNNNITIVIAPSLPFLDVTYKHSTNIKIAAQDCSRYDIGSFTGEVSASMIYSIGAHYVILGHSERRKYFLESNDIVAEKLVQVLSNNLAPVFCCGEPLEVREANAHLGYIINQIEHTIKNVIKQIRYNNNSKWEEHASLLFQNLIIAYEPIWAIGTDKIPTIEEIEDVHYNIKKCLNAIMKALNLNEIDIPVIYGGNLNVNNASSILQCDNVDGGLVGRASLDVKDFVSILRSF